LLLVLIELRFICGRASCDNTSGIIHPSVDARFFDIADFKSAGTTQFHYVGDFNLLICDECWWKYQSLLDVLTSNMEERERIFFEGA
jgi:hypothetical protein